MGKKDRGLITIHKELQEEELTPQALFKQFPEFKEWIKQTQLFDSIKTGTRAANAGVEYTMVAPGMRFTLSSGTIVTEPEDLPIEIIYQFYENYKP